MLEKLEEKRKELEEFLKLAPAPIQVEVNRKVYVVYPPTLFVVNNVEKIMADITYKRLKVAQELAKSEGQDPTEHLDKVTELFAENVDLAAKIVAIILNAKEKQVTEEEVRENWTVIDLVKVYKAYEYLVDVSDFFQTFRIPAARL